MVSMRGVYDGLCLNGGRSGRSTPVSAAVAPRSRLAPAAAAVHGAVNEGAALFAGPSRKEFAAKREFVPRRDIVARRFPAPRVTDRLQVDVLEAEETVDVIDLGAPRLLRRTAPQPLPGGAPRARSVRRTYTPNPRLYPGPAPKTKRKPRSSGHAGRAARRRVFRRPVPNARLYRPAPRRLPPPPLAPRGPWPPPAPPAPRALDTASHAALRLAAHRAPLAPHAPHALHAPLAPQPSYAHFRSPAGARRLVVTLPAGAAGGRSGAAAGMDAARRSSPDDCSDNDALSAPSEFLAEFLSAIMRRQHAEALKYCRLILQYEPHNATARGFYPLLQHKVQALKQNEGAGCAGAGAGAGGGSSSGSSAYSPAQQSPRSHSTDDERSPRQEESGAAGRGAVGSRSRSGARSRSESGGSVASQSSLELDSSSGSSASAGASDSCSPTRSRSEPDSSDARDDNGNVPPHNLSRSDDVENDNDVSRVKSESSSSSLRRLRAQFACSIK